MTTQNTFITVLDHERLATFTGAENGKFLQGQVTCDVNRLLEGESVLGACCNPKGRIIANFRMVAIGKDLVISLPADQSEHLREHLKKYAAFFRTVTITDTTAQWQRIGISGADAIAIVAELTGTDAPSIPNTQSWEHGLVVPVDAQRFELWINTEESFQTIWQNLAQQSTVAPVSHWQREDIRSGIAWVIEASREAWIPQHLNWQALDGISFKKGCYTGQEIVARMKYLGKLKSHLYRFSAPMSDTSNNAETVIGTAILNSTGSKCGDIVVAESNQERDMELLAVVRKSDVEAGQLTLADGTPLTLQSLPYSIEE